MRSALLLKLVVANPIPRCCRALCAVWRRNARVQSTRGAADPILGARVPKRQIWWCSESLQLRPFVVLMIHSIFWHLVFIWRRPLIQQFVVSVPKVSYSYNVWHCQSRLWDTILMDILGVINYIEAFSIWQFMIDARITFSGVLNRTKTKMPTKGNDR